jgi:hypothetical protein
MKILRLPGGAFFGKTAAACYHRQKDRKEVTIGAVQLPARSKLLDPAAFMKVKGKWKLTAFAAGD